MPHMKIFHYQEVLELVNWQKLGLKKIGKIVGKALD
jgi:hypothetical protein